jgi:hypothetical protein
MNQAKTPFSTEIFAGAIISMVQYLAPLRYGVFRPIDTESELGSMSTMPCTKMQNSHELATLGLGFILSGVIAF